MQLLSWPVFVFLFGSRPTVRIFKSTNSPSNFPAWLFSKTPASTSWFTVKHLRFWYAAKTAALLGGIVEKTTRLASSISWSVSAFLP